MKDVLFIDNYDSYSYNILQMLEESGVSFDILKHDSVTEKDFISCKGIIISPGPGLPSEYPIHTEAIAHCVCEKKKFLGICLGLQSLVCHFGGKLKNHPIPAHGITRQLDIFEVSHLFAGIPNNSSVGLYHSWYADETSFPDELRVTVKSDEGIIMAAEHVTRPLFGVQFHPESYMTQHGERLLLNWLNM